MKLYKLKALGSVDSFKIEYTYSTNFIDYSDFGFSGSEEEKYEKFIEDLKIHGGIQPINVKVNMSTLKVDRAFSKNELLTVKDVHSFIKKLGQ
jgi:hypothetical protein